MNSNEAQAMVLAEYRRNRRVGGRPFPAMKQVANDAAHAYMFGVIAQRPPDHEQQLRALARFRAADGYSQQIIRRYRRPPAETGFWLNGVTRERVSS